MLSTCRQLYMLYKSICVWGHCPPPPPPVFSPLSSLPNAAIHSVGPSRVIRSLLLFVMVPRRHHRDFELPCINRILSGSDALRAAEGACHGWQNVAQFVNHWETDISSYM